MILTSKKIPSQHHRGYYSDLGTGYCNSTQLVHKISQQNSLLFNVTLFFLLCTPHKPQFLSRDNDKCDTTVLQSTETELTFFVQEEVLKSTDNV